MQLSAKAHVGAGAVLATTVLWAALARAAGPAPFVQTGAVEHPQLTEISGLAASRARRGVFWALNDSGNAASLYAIGFDGEVLGSVAVRGARNVDWEDLAWFQAGGRPYLAIADVGDNFSWRSEVVVYIVPEPGPEATEVEVERELRFVYSDGARDVESLAVDAAGGRLLLLAKHAQDAGLYALPLDADQPASVARRIADLPALWPLTPGAAVAPISAQRLRGAATAMDLSADGRRLLVLTYTHLFVFERGAVEDWPQALARAPQAYALPQDAQGFEAACFDADDRSIWITHEGTSAKLYWRP